MPDKVTVLFAYCDKCKRVTRHKNGKCINHGWL